MKTFAVVLLVALFVVGAVAQDEESKCHPECRWQCDDPVCPAICHPICERPKCEMKCDQTPCAECTVHCAKPKCSVRCPKDMCELESCPKCETICAPAECHTTCKAPEPVCSPVCEDTKCEWKCKKPTTCPKPKCELQCEKPTCEAQTPEAAPAEPTCCGCTAAPNAAAAVELANKVKVTKNVVPSFLEVMHGVRHQRQQGEQMCCPCAN